MAAPARPAAATVDDDLGSPWWRAVNGTVDFWMSFADYPTARAWYRAHNGSVVAAYLEHRDLAEAENATERFFTNVVLCRVLYAHALVAAPRIALGWLRPLAPFLGDPRLGMAGVIVPRLQRLYEWSAHELAAPGLLDCIRDGALTYAWSFEDRDVWQPPQSFIVRTVHRALPPERRA